VICHYGLAFFERHLLERQTAAAVLKEQDAAWSYSVADTGTGASWEWGREPPVSSTGPGGIRDEIRKGIIERTRERRFDSKGNNGAD
jgi:hypothetical protein